MKAKTVIGMAVAGALSWSYGAMANDAMHRMHGDRVHSHHHMSYSDRAQDRGYIAVVTPFSPNETGVADWSQDRDRYRDDTASSAPVDHAVVTPLADNEAGPNDIRGQMQARAFDTAGTSMANMQTPLADNEAGPNRYGENLREHAQQVAEVDHARIAASEWNARVAAGPTAPELNEPAGGTSGLGLQGSNERSVSPESTPLEGNAVQGDATQMPQQHEPTSALEPGSDTAVPVTQYNAVGVLETPSEASDYRVWNVEPLAPQADLRSGDTEYLTPDGSNLVFLEPPADNAPQDVQQDQSAASSESIDSSSNL